MYLGHKEAKNNSDSSPLSFQFIPCSAAAGYNVNYFSYFTNIKKTLLKTNVKTLFQWIRSVLKLGKQMVTTHLDWII